MFQREDWTLFRNLTTLGQKAGVRQDRLPSLVAKEIVDNALDASGSCQIGPYPRGHGNGFWVEDRGKGIGDADDAEVASMFSIGRPLTSSKLLRLPTRGALGNGLRVVAGAVLASGGSLIVSTRGRTLRLVPQDDGTTRVDGVTPYAKGGTRIEVRFGHSLTMRQGTLGWAMEAITLAGGGPKYGGKTSPHWYDPDAFFELTQAAGGRTVRELISEFDGCSEPKAGKISAAFRARLARDLDRPEARVVLAVAKAQAKPVRPNRLGTVGPISALPEHYAKLEGTLLVHLAADGDKTFVPVVIEAWAELDGGDTPEARVFVNRSPITAVIEAVHHKDLLWLAGCGLDHPIKVGRKPPRVYVNIETPYMPITSDGKAPDLRPLLPDIEAIVGKVVKKARRTAGTSAPAVSQKGAILSCLDEGIAHAGGGRHRFGQRQLYYSIRDLLKKKHVGLKEPTWEYFCDVITDYESEIGRDIPGMYRDTRGTLYHPHTGEEIPLGTLNVEQYRRPEWTFNKILYCEKEGFFPILKDVGFPERHDCALMTSKGFASRAARDVIDLLGNTDEELFFYCIHDADAAGTMIYQTLQEGTRARGARNVHIINLGLEPEEALAMGLEAEPVERKEGKVAPVAGYVDEEWREWLQKNRVELNAMTTPQFLGWLDRKFADQVGKVIPPADVLIDRLQRDTQRALERRITRKILRRANVPARVERAMERRLPSIQALDGTIRADVERHLAAHPAEPWTGPVRLRAGAIARPRQRAVRPGSGAGRKPVGEAKDGP
jgi:hypothetical protein